MKFLRWLAGVGCILSGFYVSGWCDSNAPAGGALNPAPELIAAAPMRTPDSETSARIPAPAAADKGTAGPAVTDDDKDKIIDGAVLGNSDPPDPPK